MRAAMKPLNSLRRTIVTDEYDGKIPLLRLNVENDGRLVRTATHSQPMSAVVTATTFGANTSPVPKNEKNAFGLMIGAATAAPAPRPRNFRNPRRSIMRLFLGLYESR